MKQLPSLALLALLFASPAAPAPADDPATPARPAAPAFRYRGFTADAAGLAGVEDPEPILAALRQQIDQVAEARVRPEVAEFFRRVPIKFGGVSDENHGSWSGRSVHLVARPIPPERGVLIHELIHAYDAKVLDAATKRRLDRFYGKALLTYDWGTDEYFLSNRREFFAVTASAYLRGRVGRPPFTREAIRTAQPEYADFLAELFDPIPAVRAEPARNPAPAAPPGPKLPEPAATSR